MKTDKVYTNNYGSAEKTVHMSFEVSERLRNQFKSKITSSGKKVKDVITELMEEYLKDKKDYYEDKKRK